MAKAYEVEVLLAGGRTIEAVISDDWLEDLRRMNPNIHVPRGFDDHEAVGRLILGSLQERIRKGTGVYMMPDKDGRHWIMSGQAMVAANLRGFDGDTTPGSLGFRNPDS